MNKFKCSLTLICLFFLTSCTTYVKTAQFNGKLTEFRQQIDQFCIKVEADFKERTSLYNSVRIQRETNPVAAAPLEKIYTEMQGQKKSIDDKRQEIIALEATLYRITNGKEKITSRDSQFPRIKEIRDRAQALGKEIQSAGNTYSKSAQQFNTIAKESGISKYDPAAIKSQMEVENSRYLKNLQEIDGKLKEAHARKDLTAEQQQALSDFEQLFADAKGIRAKAVKELEMTLQEFPSPQVVVPGSKLAQRLNELQLYRQQATELRQKADQIQARFNTRKS